MKPAEPVQMKIKQSNTYRKDLRLLHLEDKAGVQEAQQVKNLAYLFLQLISQFQEATRSTSPDMTTVFHA